MPLVKFIFLIKNKGINATFGGIWTWDLLHAVTTTLQSIYINEKFMVYLGVA